MTGWGTSIRGFAETVETFRDIQTAWDDGVLYLAGPTVNYAIHNEYGTSKMEARPFIRPAADRVQNDPERYAVEMAGTHGIDISSEAGFVKALALAVQNEAKNIADAKDVRESGDLIASISIQRVD